MSKRKKKKGSNLLTKWALDKQIKFPRVVWIIKMWNLAKWNRLLQMELPWHPLLVIVLVLVLVVV